MSHHFKRHEFESNTKKNGHEKVEGEEEEDNFEYSEEENEGKREIIEKNKNWHLKEKDEFEFLPPMEMGPPQDHSSTIGRSKFGKSNFGATAKKNYFSSDEEVENEENDTQELEEERLEVLEKNKNWHLKNQDEFEFLPPMEMGSPQNNALNSSKFGKSKFNQPISNSSDEENEELEDNEDEDQNQEVDDDEKEKEEERIELLEKNKDWHLKGKEEFEYLPPLEQGPPTSFGKSSFGKSNFGKTSHSSEEEEEESEDEIEKDEGISSKDEGNEILEKDKNWHLKGKEEFNYLPPLEQGPPTSFGKSNFGKSNFGKKSYSSEEEEEEEELNNDVEVNILEKDKNWHLKDQNEFEFLPPMEMGPPQTKSNFGKSKFTKRVDSSEEEVEEGKEKDHDTNEFIEKNKDWHLKGNEEFEYLPPLEGDVIKTSLSRSRFGKPKPRSKLKPKSKYNFSGDGLEIEGDDDDEKEKKTESREKDKNWHLKGNEDFDYLPPLDMGSNQTNSLSSKFGKSKFGAKPKNNVDEDELEIEEKEKEKEAPTTTTPTKSTTTNSNKTSKRSSLIIGNESQSSKKLTNPFKKKYSKNWLNEANHLESESNDSLSSESFEIPKKSKFKRKFLNWNTFGGEEEESKTHDEEKDTPQDTVSPTFSKRKHQLEQKEKEKTPEDYTPRKGLELRRSSIPTILPTEVDRIKNYQEENFKSHSKKKSLDWTPKNSNRKSMIEPIPIAEDEILPEEKEIVKETSVIDRKIEDGNKMVNQYMILFELGRGAFGKVKLCVDVETQQHYVIFLFSFPFFFFFF